MHRVIEEIQESNKWRDGEFAKFKIKSSKINDKLWFRMCIPMIYAHWEGFIIDSLKTLLEHLNTLSLIPSQTATNLVVIGIGESYKKLSGKQSFKQKIEFTNKINETFNNPIKFSKKIDTKSNLRSDVLKEICQMYGFNFENFKEQTSVIDRLVNIRNSIAHGENSVVPDEDNITKYINTINKAMDIFLNEINIFLDNESYKL